MFRRLSLLALLALTHPASADDPPTETLFRSALNTLKQTNAVPAG